MMDNFETEMVIMALTCCNATIQARALQDKVERFEEYFQRYGKWIQLMREGESIDRSSENGLTLDFMD